MKKKKKKPIKVRLKWAINPATKVEKEDVGYDRKKQKRDLRKVLKEENL